MKKFLPYLIIAITTCLVFSPYLLGYVGITPHVGTNDNTDTQIPFRSALQESLRQGRVPLWEPRISAGFPLLAEGQAGVFHPLNVLSALLPITPYLSVSINILTTIIISGIGMYLFAYAWLQKKGERSENKALALFAAFVWCYSGFHINHFAHLNNINVLSMLPWQLLIIDKILNQKFRLIYIPAFATTVALQIFSGHPQFTAYALMFNALYFLASIILEKQTFKKTIISTSIVILGLILGFGIGAIQLLPTLEFTQNSTRQSGISEESANFLSFRIQDLITFVSPFYDFNHEPRTPERLANIGWPFDERYSYIGIIPILLGLMVLPFVLKDKRVLILTFLGIFFLVLSFGNQSPIGILLRIPPLNMFRLPAKFTVFFQFAMAIAATYTLYVLLNKYRKDKPGENSNKKTVIIATIIVITVMDTTLKVYRLYPLVKGGEWYQTPSTVKAYIAQEGVNQTDRLPPILGQDYNVQLQKQYFYQSPDLWNTKQTEVFKNNREILPAFNMLYYKVPLLTNAINSAGLKVNYYSQIENELFFAREKVISETQTSYTETYWKLARLAGAQYMIHDDTLHDENVELIAKSSLTTGQDQINLYKIKDPLAFIQIPQNIQIIPETQTYQAILSDQFNPQTDLIISNAQAMNQTESPSSDDSTYTIKTQIPEQIQINITTTAPQYILIRQTFYPGWSASIDGKITEVLRANHAFQAVRIPDAGAHQILLTYSPTSFTTGRLVTIVSLVIYTLLITTAWIGKLKAPKPTNISA